MERLLVIWCPRLLEEKEDGRAAREFARVVETARAFSPAATFVRPGICAVPTRGPSRYFGGDLRLAQLLVDAVRELPDQLQAQVGVADGLFAAVLAARAAGPTGLTGLTGGGPLVVPPEQSATFLAPWPVEILERPELADLLRRLGIHTLGAFAALPTRHVLGRLGTEGIVSHELARGVRSEPPGYRTVPRPPGARRTGPRRARRPAPTREKDTDGAPRPRQDGFWGEAAQSEARAGRAVGQLEQLLGPEAVVVGRLQGGRGPAERARLVPWSGRQLGPDGPGPEPWPGQLPPPAPVIVLDQPRPVVVVDAGGNEIVVNGAGLPSGIPDRLSVAGGPWQVVTAWAGPWPVDERWWAVRRRRARMQLVTHSGMACLVVRERAGWWLEGTYD